MKPSSLIVASRLALTAAQRHTDPRKKADCLAIAVALSRIDDQKWVAREREKRVEKRMGR